MFTRFPAQGIWFARLGIHLQSSFHGCEEGGRKESLFIAQSDGWGEGATHSHIAGGVDFSKSAVTLNEKKIKQDVISYSGYELVFLILKQVLFKIQLNFMSLIKKIQKTFYVVGLVALVRVLIAYDLTQEVSEA